jgi:hypothetical protein
MSYLKDIDLAAFREELRKIAERDNITEVSSYRIITASSREYFVSSFEDADRKEFTRFYRNTSEGFSLEFEVLGWTGKAYAASILRHRERKEITMGNKQRRLEQFEKKSDAVEKAKAVLDSTRIASGELDNTDLQNFLLSFAECCRSDRHRVLRAFHELVFWDE